jgi:hypothetical protein
MIKLFLKERGICSTIKLIHAGRAINTLKVVFYRAINCASILYGVDNCLNNGLITRGMEQGAGDFRPCLEFYNLKRPARLLPSTNIITLFFNRHSFSPIKIRKPLQVSRFELFL